MTEPLTVEIAERLDAAALAAPPLPREALNTLAGLLATPSTVTEAAA